MVDNQNTKIQFKRKKSDADLANIALNEGEPLFIPGLDQLRIGKGHPSAENNTAANALILGSATLTAEETDEGDGAQLVFTNSDTSKSSTIPIVGSDNLSVTYDTTNKKIKLNGTAQVIVVEDCPEDTTDVDALGPGTTNSIGIVKRKIGSSADKYSYTAYVYNEGTWKAMDGNYSADNVYFSEDITITEDFGKYKKANNELCPNFDSSGNYVLQAKGKALSNLISDAFSSETQGWTRNPNYTFTVSNNSSGEVGTTYTLPTATFTVTSVGEYQYGPATGITYDATVTAGEATATRSNLTAAEGNNTVSVEYVLPSGLSNKYTDSSITHQMSYTYSHTGGAVPNTNVASTTITTTPIAAKTNQTDSLTTTFTGYRKSFYVLNKKTADISQTAKISGSVWSHFKPTSISVPQNSTSLLICVPGSDITSVTATDDLAMNSPVTLTSKGNTTLAYNSNGTQTEAYTYSVFQVVWDVPLATAKRLTLEW